MRKDSTIAEIPMNTYEPQPIDTSGIRLPDGLLELTEEPGRNRILPPGAA